MAVDPATLLAHKGDIVRRMFADTADNNYIAARWCYWNGLDVDFLWLSVHAIEKYLKASLLMNGRSAKKGGHDIKKLLGKVRGFASDLLPPGLRLQRPDEVPHMYWRNETLVQFVARLNQDGSAANRYQETGYVRHAEDLMKLDQTVSAIRGLCACLDAPITRRTKPGRAPTYRQYLKSQHEPWHLSGDRPLEKARRGKRGEEVRRALLDWNFPMAPNDFHHTPTRRVGSSASNSVLGRRILEVLAYPSPQSRELGEALQKWVLKNIQLSDDVRECIKKGNP